MRRRSVILLPAVSLAAACDPAPAPSPSSVPADPSPLPTGEPPTVTLFHSTHLDGEWVTRGGVTFAHYAGVLARARAALTDPAASLFAGNGDDMSDAIGGRWTGGLHVLRMFGAAGMDVATYGFNEIDFGLDRIGGLLAGSPVTMVSANVRDRRTGRVYNEAAGAKEFVIRTAGGVRVGLTGLITTIGPRTWAAQPNIEVVAVEAAMATVVPQMRAAGAEVVVIASHLDTRQEAQRLTAAVPGIDVILGAHIGDPSDRLQRTASGALVSTPPWNLASVGQLDLTVSGGKITSATLRVHPVSRDSAPDPAIAQLYKDFGVTV